MGSIILFGFAAIALIILIIIVGLIKIYNGFVTARNRVKTQWAQIDVQLKRRSDMIPNLVECVKGYAKHESELFERVTQARSRMAGASSPKEVMDANAGLSAALGRVFALSEAYPELKANANFLQLQNELKETESKIAHARQFYNDTVLLYKDRITLFPGNILAKVFGFQEAPFFEATEDEKQNVRVSF